MSENPNYSRLRENPEIIRSIMANCIDEITARSDGTTNLKQKKEEIIRNGWRENVGEPLQNMWKELDITARVQYIHSLSTTYPQDFVAWRPTVGEVPSRNLEGTYLTEYRDRLTYKLAKIRQNKKELEEKLFEKNKALDKYIAKLNEAEQRLDAIAKKFSSFALEFTKK